MADETVSLLVTKADADVLRTAARILRAGGREAGQIRDFTTSFDHRQKVNGLRFQPYPGQVLVCAFGLGFAKPEIVKTRPVIVVSPQPRFASGLCTVVPISSTRPEHIEPYHYKLPPGLIPGKTYAETWVKGDLIQTVALHRLDRIKAGPRQYCAPIVRAEILHEIRRCILHATGMHTLTPHW